MDTMELVERIATMETRVESLEAWQGKQNGSLQRLEAKVDKLLMFIVGLLGGVTVNLIITIAKTH